MRIDRDAAAVVGDGERAVRGKLDLDEAGMARHGLVHRIVDHLGEEVVQRLLVGAADIHAGAAAHGLQPLQHLDVGGGVAAFRRPVRGAAHALRRPFVGAPRGGGGRGRGVGKQVGAAGGLSLRGFRHIYRA